MSKTKAPLEGREKEHLSKIGSTQDDPRGTDNSGYAVNGLFEVFHLRQFWCDPSRPLLFRLGLFKCRVNSVGLEFRRRNFILMSSSPFRLTRWHLFTIVLRMRYSQTMVCKEMP